MLKSNNYYTSQLVSDPPTQWDINKYVYLYFKGTLSQHSLASQQLGKDFIMNQTRMVSCVNPYYTNKKVLYQIATL